MGGKRIKLKKRSVIIGASNTVKPLKRALLVCFAVLFVAAVGVIISTINFDFNTENSGIDDTVQKTYREYIDFAEVKDEVIGNYGEEMRPEGYDENIMNGLAVLLEKNGSDGEKKYKVVVDMGEFEREFYEEWKEKGNSDENGLLRNYIEERKALSDKLKKEEIGQEEYNTRLAGAAVKYRTALAELEQGKTDWMHLKRVKILVSFSGEELADGYYLIEADRGEIEELAESGYVLRLLGEGLKKLAEGSEEGADKALIWMLGNSEKEELSVGLSLRIGEGTAKVGNTEAGIKLGDFLSGLQLIEKYNDTVGFSVSYRIDGEERYSTADCELILTKQEISELLKIKGNGSSLSFICKEENVSEYAEYFYSVYGDGVFKNIQEIKES